MVWPFFLSMMLQSSCPCRPPQVSRVWVRWVLLGWVRVGGSIALPVFCLVLLSLLLLLLPLCSWSVLSCLVLSNPALPCSVDFVLSWDTGPLCAAEQ